MNRAYGTFLNAFTALNAFAVADFLYIKLAVSCAASTAVTFGLIYFNPEK